MIMLSIYVAVDDRVQYWKWTDVPHDDYHMHCRITKHWDSSGHRSVRELVIVS